MEMGGGYAIDPWLPVTLNGEKMECDTRDHMLSPPAVWEIHHALVEIPAEVSGRLLAIRVRRRASDICTHVWLLQWAPNPNSDYAPVCGRDAHVSM